MKSLHVAMVSVLLAAAMLAANSCQRPATTTITIGAMPPGTSWYLFAATLSGLLQERLRVSRPIRVWKSSLAEAASVIPSS
jgi:ABC-type nitrate/sulfonate/bicarbonate transport system substrate-binding protein